MELVSQVDRDVIPILTRYSSAVEAPGELIASGRDSDIFHCGNGRVLRRSRNGRSQTHEARTMEFVRSQGYPVPEVFSVSDDGIDLVMARIDGPTMIEAASAQPSKLEDFARELASLHQSLHRLQVPEWLNAAPVGSGESLLHMDLHPLNVILSNKGPVVVDWTNAARGNPLVDVAVTWVLLASGEITGDPDEVMMVNVGREIFLKAFLEPFPKAELESLLGEVVEGKSRDPHMSKSEVARMHALL